jgi:uncharacterized protein YkwD
VARLFVLAAVAVALVSASVSAPASADAAAGRGRFTVLTATGHPVAGVSGQVTVTRAGLAQSRWATSDRDGAIAVAGEAGEQVRFESTGQPFDGSGYRRDYCPAGFTPRTASAQLTLSPLGDPVARADATFPVVVPELTEPAHSATELAFIAALNAQRAALSLPALTANARLGAVADAQATTSDALGYRAHEGRNCETVLVRAAELGVLAGIAGEVALYSSGQVDRPDADAALALWKSSPPHWGALTLARITDIGAARVRGMWVAVTAAAPTIAWLEPAPPRLSPPPPTASPTPDTRVTPAGSPTPDAPAGSPATDRRVTPAGSPAADARGTPASRPRVEPPLALAALAQTRRGALRDGVRVRGVAQHAGTVTVTIRLGNKIAGVACVRVARPGASFHVRVRLRPAAARALRTRRGHARLPVDAVQGTARATATLKLG